MNRPIDSITRILYLFGFVVLLGYHVGSFAIFSTEASLGAIAFAVIAYTLRMFATSAFYHRQITHHSFEAPVWLVRVGCLVACSAGQMGPSWWKAHHLAHHAHTDTPLDPHSPHAPMEGWLGFLNAHCLWLLRNFIPQSLPSDIEDDPVLYWIDRLHFVPFLLLMSFTWYFLGVSYAAWLCLSTTVMFHSMCSLNSICHAFGSRPFSVYNKSTNNTLVAWLTLGEGWHNTHHALPNSPRFGYSVSQGKVTQCFDLTYILIYLMHHIGLCKLTLRLPEHQLQARIHSMNG